MENETVSPNTPSTGTPSTGTSSTGTQRTFADLISNESLLKKVTSLGFTDPTEVQTSTIPVALEGHDAIIQAQTGSGKTLAFLLPLCAKLLEEGTKANPESTYSILISPTRELALQIEQVIRDLDIGITPNVLIGGVDMDKQKKTLSKDRRIIVGTPGRILDFLKQRLIRLNECQYFVLDEADEMLSMGFIEDVRAILSRLPNKRQGLFVSATISGRVEMLAHSFLNKPKRISTINTKEEEPDITHQYIEVASDIMAKPHALCDIIEVFRPRSAIIFCNTKSDTRLVEVLLRRRGFDARRINSDLSQAQRNKIMKLIRAEDLQFLIGTDIAARGIDIAQIDLVINYNIHDQAETYVHRTGRTGRAGRSGRAISLVGPRDHGAFFHLKKVLSIDFEKIDLPSDEEVAGAKLSHLYEMIRNAKVDVSERDNIVAAKLLSDLGEIEDPTEELIQFIAKLSCYTSEHFVTSEAKSLDEELQEEEQEEKPKRKSKDSRNKREDGDRQESKRGREKGRERDNDKDRGRARDRDRDDSSRDRKDSSRKSDQEPRKEREVQPEEFRLYLGQGTSHNLNEDSFKKLAQEKADVDAKDLKKLTIREHYGFVDALEPVAKKLIENLNGIEINGSILPVEKATSLTEKPRKRRPQSRDRGRSRGRKDSNKRSSGDRRRN